MGNHDLLSAAQAKAAGYERENGKELFNPIAIVVI